MHELDEHFFFLSIDSNNWYASVKKKELFKAVTRIDSTQSLNLGNLFVKIVAIA